MIFVINEHRGSILVTLFARRTHHSSLFCHKSIVPVAVQSFAILLAQNDPTSLQATNIFCSYSYFIQPRSIHLCIHFAKCKCKMWKFYLWVVCLSLVFLGQCHEGSGAADFRCPVPVGYFPNPSECDSYFQCKDSIFELKVCPEGQFFDDRSIRYPRYPCTHIDVQCGSRTRTRVKRLPRIGRR